MIRRGELLYRLVPEASSRLSERNFAGRRPIFLGRLYSVAMQPEVGQVQLGIPLPSAIVTMTGTSRIRRQIE